MIKNAYIFYLSVFFMSTQMNIYAYSQEDPSTTDIREQKFLEAQQYRMQREQFYQNNPDSRYYNYKGQENRSTRERSKPRQVDLNTEYNQYQLVFDKNSSPEVAEYDLKSIEDRLVTGNSNNAYENKTNPQKTSRILKPKDSPVSNEHLELMEIEDNYTPPQTQTNTISSTGGIIFSVQILAKSSGSANISKLKSQYGITEPVLEDHNHNMYRYIAGRFVNYNHASEYAKTLQNKGIYDAFVVAYQNGTRVPVSTVVR
jgi:hypothetical protein